MHSPVSSSDIIGVSGLVRNLHDTIKKVADEAGVTVLIQGESGTGKELVAQAIHSQSVRARKNFVPINCAAIPDELLESELFGHVRGAFTGAAHAKMGRIEYAHEGTLFLDEIGDMKPSLQAKLLRVLQEREFEPVGGLKAVPVDVRVIAATHRDLESLVQAGGFRQDLFYRLSVVPIVLPPLRDRKEDIPILIDFFIQRGKKNCNRSMKGFSRETMQLLQNYAWPGNIRELENLVQHMTVLYAGREITPLELPPRYRTERTGEYTRNADEEGAAPTPSGTGMMFDGHVETIWKETGIDFTGIVENFENSLIRKALVVSSGNRKEASRLLGLKRTTLLEKMKKRGISAAE